MGIAAMRAPIIINESPTPLKPGCIYVFSSVELAERYFEAWYADESYCACDADGKLLIIQPDQRTGSVCIMEQQNAPARPDLTASFLRAYIAGLLSLNKIEKSEFNDAWLHSASTADLAEVSLRHATE